MLVDGLAESDNSRRSRDWLGMKQQILWRNRKLKQVSDDVYKRESLLGLLLGMVLVAGRQNLKTHGWFEVWQTRLGFPKVCGRS